MDFRVLGPLDVSDGQGRLAVGGRRQQAVLAALLLHANRPVSTDWLIDAVWGEAPPATARKTLQAYVSRLRGVLGDRALEALHPGYVLHVEPFDVDAIRFEHLAGEGHDLVDADPSAAARVLRGALDLWRGLPWGDLGGEPAFEADAQRLVELRLSAIKDRIEADAALGRAPNLIGELQGLVAQHPWREAFSAQLMLALYRCGRQAEALHVYEDLRRSLVDELGIDPSAELQQLNEQILQQDPRLDLGLVSAEPEPPLAVRNPYKGLRPFDEEDAADFFGRRALIEELQDRVRGGGVVAVVGASGSGKSSAVRAGLIPALRATASDRCRIATLVPGADPIAELHAALLRAGDDEASIRAQFLGDDLDLLRALPVVAPDDGDRLVLVVDQFEELFVLTEQPERRSRFVRNLVEAVEDPDDRLAIVLTLRADFFDRALDQPGLGELLTDGMVSVLPLSAVELESAIVDPAVSAGLSVDPELTAQLIADMADRPGALPLFQFLLTELFAERVGDRLSLAAYAAFGGLGGALDRRADELFARLSPGHQDLALQVFLRLVAFGEGGDDTRRRAPRAELEGLAVDAGAVAAVLDSFGRARLLSFDRDPVTNEPTVQLAHEALLWGWERLRHWIVEARDELRLQRMLAAEVREWLEADRSPDYLLRGSRLDLYEAVRSGTSLLLSDDERRYLDASLAWRQQERDADQLRRADEARLERRAERRLKWLVAVVSIAAVVGAVLAIVAVERSRDAEASAQQARARELAAASLANLERDPELSVLLALEAIDATRSHGAPIVREAEEALHSAVSGYRSPVILPAGSDVVFVPAGPLLVGGVTSALVDPDDGATIADLGPRGANALAVASAADGSRVATGGADGSVSVWDLRMSDGSAVEHRWAASHGEVITGLRFSPDGDLLASASPLTKSLRLWRVDDGILTEDIPLPKPELWGFDGPLVRLAFDPPGRRIAVTGAIDGSVRMYDLDRHTWTLTLSGHAPVAVGVDFSSDGSRIFTGAYDGTVKVWDVTGGSELFSIDTGVGQVIGLDLAEDDSMVVVGGTRGLVELWQLDDADGRLVSTLAGHEATVGSVGLDASGRRLATSGYQEAVRIWTLEAGTGSEWATFEARSAEFSPDGTRLALGGPGGDVTIVDTGTWAPVVVLPDVAPYVHERQSRSWVAGLAFSPNGKQIVTASHGFGYSYGAVQLWDVETGRLIRTLVTETEPTAPTFSADGARIAVALCDGRSPARVWAADEGTLLFEVRSTGCSRAADIDHDGRLLAVQLMDVVANVQVWDVDTGERVSGAISHLPGFIGAAELRPDGRTVLTAGRDGRGRTWDIDSGESRRRLEEHEGAVERAVWSPDGSRIATGDASGAVRIWNAETGDLELRLPGDGSMVVDLDFSPDGQRLASASERGTVSVWAIDPDDLVRIAEARVTRSLSETECAAYRLRCSPKG